MSGSGGGSPGDLNFFGPDKRQIKREIRREIAKVETAASDKKLSGGRDEQSEARTGKGTDKTTHQG